MPDHQFRGPLLVLAGTANRALAEEVAEHLGFPLGDVTIRRFADGEIFVRIDQNARGRDVFIIQPTPPPADNFMELLLLIDAARRASAARITVVTPYYGYARQDRKDQPRVAIGAKLVANLIEAAGADRTVVDPGPANRSVTSTSTRSSPRRRKARTPSRRCSSSRTIRPTAATSSTGKGATRTRS